MVGCLLQVFFQNHEQTLKQLLILATVPLFFWCWTPLKNTVVVCRCQDWPRELLRWDSLVPQLVPWPPGGRQALAPTEGRRQALQPEFGDAVAWICWFWRLLLGCKTTVEFSIDHKSIHFFLNSHFFIISSFFSSSPSGEFQIWKAAGDGFPEVGCGHPRGPSAGGWSVDHLGWLWSSTFAQCGRTWAAGNCGCLATSSSRGECHRFPGSNGSACCEQPELAGHCEAVAWVRGQCQRRNAERWNTPVSGLSWETLAPGLPAWSGPNCKALAECRGRYRNRRVETWEGNGEAETDWRPTNRSTRFGQASEKIAKKGVDLSPGWGVLYGNRVSVEQCWTMSNSVEQLLKRCDLFVFQSVICSFHTVFSSFILGSKRLVPWRYLWPPGSTTSSTSSTTFTSTSTSSTSTSSSSTSSTSITSTSTTSSSTSSSSTSTTSTSTSSTSSTSATGIECWKLLKRGFSWILGSTEWSHMISK